LAIATAAEVAVEGDLALHGWGLPLGLQDAFDRHLLDPALQCQHWNILAHIECAVGLEAAVVEAATQGVELELAVDAGRFEHGILDRQFAQGQLAEGEISIDIQFAQVRQRQQLVGAPGAFGRRIR